MVNNMAVKTTQKGMHGLQIAGVAIAVIGALFLVYLVYGLLIGGGAYQNNLTYNNTQVGNGGVHVVSSNGNSSGTSVMIGGFQLWNFASAVLMMLLGIMIFKYYGLKNLLEP